MRHVRSSKFILPSLRNKNHVRCRRQDLMDIFPDERKKISFVAFAVQEKPCAIQSETKPVKAGQLDLLMSKICDH